MKRARKILKWGFVALNVAYAINLIGKTEVERRKLEQNFRRAMAELNSERIKSENFKRMFTSLAQHAGDDAVNAWQESADSDVQFLEIKEAAEAEGDANGETTTPQQEA